MHVLTTVAALRAWRESALGRVGFVPTMGYLHEGHLSLTRAARAATDTVAASIFVNPTQFGPNEDLARYPRDPDRDLALLEAEGVAAVFMPSPEEMYPSGFATFVEVGPVATRLEGAARLGHFRGVATVVCKLFGIVRPDEAFFGQKDAQQLLVIRRMTSDLNLGVEIVAAPTVREPDGLALSSRNVYLSAEERQRALAISRALRLAEQRLIAGAQPAAVRAAMRRLLRAAGITRIVYVSVADAASLEELTEFDRPALVSLAVWVGGTRLIDNVLVARATTATPVAADTHAGAR